MRLFTVAANVQHEIHHQSMNKNCAVTDAVLSCCRVRSLYFLLESIISTCIWCSTLFWITNKGYEQWPKFEEICSNSIPLGSEKWVGTCLHGIIANLWSLSCHFVSNFCVFLTEWVEIKLFHHRAKVGYTCIQKLWRHVLHKFVQHVHCTLVLVCCLWKHSHIMFITLLMKSSWLLLVNIVFVYYCWMLDNFDVLIVYVDRN